MMKMKRTGWLILSVLLMLTFAACGQKAEKTAATEQTTAAAKQTAAHTLATGAPSNISKEPVMLYCGNTFTTIYENDVQYGFDGSRSVDLTDLLVHLQYTEPVCNCLPEYTVDTEFGTGYGISLSGGYVRHDGKQVTLTKEQHDMIAEIIAWAQKSAAKGTVTQH